MVNILRPLAHPLDKMVIGKQGEGSSDQGTRTANDKGSLIVISISSFTNICMTNVLQGPYTYYGYKIEPGMVKRLGKGNTPY
jgi:hypothetical protein